MPPATARRGSWALGLLACAAIAAVGELTARATGDLASPVAVAVLLGLLLSPTLPAVRSGPGVTFAMTRLLRLGIVLLGARLSLQEVGALGLRTVGLVALVLVVAATAVALLGPRIGLSTELSALLGIGSAVCGNTAIMASAPTINAAKRDTGLAVAAITLWGTVALLTYPLLGRALGLSDATYGVWVGLAIQDTAQVVAGGAAFSEEARDVAVVVKLLRNTSLALVLPLLAWWWQRRGGDVTQGARRTLVPGFVLGFLAMAALRTLGVIDADLAEMAGTVAGGAILLAVAGIGLSVGIDGLRVRAKAALLVGAAAAVSVGLVGLAGAVLVT
jgi:uncharacterized integral membrane protein (TIGR00698 family)